MTANKPHIFYAIGALGIVGFGVAVSSALVMGGVPLASIIGFTIGVAGFTLTAVAYFRKFGGSPIAITAMVLPAVITAAMTPVFQINPGLAFAGVATVFALTTIALLAFAGKSQVRRG